MKLRIYNIIILLLLAVSVSCRMEARQKKSPEPFLEARTDMSKAVAGERLMYEVILYTPDPSVAGVELAVSPQFSGLPHTPSSPDSNLDTITIDGKRYFSAVIDRYFVGVNNKGKYVIKGGAYRVGINRRMEVNDPFWGPTVVSRVEAIDLKSPDVTVKVGELPEKDRPSDFSGAVGEFSISAYLPEGDIRAGEDAELIVTVSGFGDLANATLPEIRKALPEGLVFKSMTENREFYVKDGSLGSEIEIECVFTPREEGEYCLDGLKFTFFNSKKEKYETSVAPPLIIKTVESGAKSEKPSVIMDV